MEIRKMYSPFCYVCCALVAMLAASQAAWGAGGTAIVAQKGQPAYIADGLPEGVSGLINHPRRTTGWSPWFTEWPNDVHHYALEAKTTEEINDLLITLAAVDTPVRQVRLSYEKEPASIGWVTRLPEKNNIPVMFSIGNQEQVNQWHARTGSPIGKIEFADTPVAVVPTLTIYVRNKVVDLEKLELPEGLKVEVGGVPGVFHKWNKVEDKQPKLSEEEARELMAKLEARLDDEEKEAKAKIEEFLKEYAKRAKEAEEDRPEGSGEQRPR